MGRSRPKPAPEPEDISQDPPDNDFLSPEESIANAAAEPGNQATPSKADMVRSAMAEGMDNPGDGTAWIKARYGVEMPRQLWSSYVAQQKARDRKAAGGESTTRPRSSSQPQPMGIPAGFGADIKAIKNLLETAGGAEQLKDLAGTIGSLVQKYGVGGLNDLIDAFE